MFTLEDSLLLITDKCTYQVQLADQIDPERKNPALPHNFQQKLFDHGTESDLLRRTLIQAKVMFRKEFQNVDIAIAMRQALEAFSNLVSMKDISLAFTSAQKSALEKVEAGDESDRSMTVPAVGNVRDQAKTFMQKADHFGLALLKIMRLFYPAADNWDGLHSIVKTQYGERDNFYKVSEFATPMLRLFRDARDALEHNPANVIVKDFEPQPDGNIWVPSILIQHRKTNQERIALAQFMEESVTSLSMAFEMLIVHACAKAVKPFGGIPMTIAVLSDEHQKTWHVRFAYGTYFADGQFVPCG